ncbi:hypothetical protein E2K98_13190 [Bacillus salipaludis]|uniref:Uncharacterized protein n=1 Tax=Bacillus salipaludis TaxID=2547811 RepID=A0A4R5VS58_9BACI|nr:hypothetical protein [Bacillus salipaludis]MDQ6598779.1 hypothetical protein [Bacillus salipaludis]TDK60680.1 hypothetical protein E2K98_13190 [Bacillus salipaludis]
MGLDMYLFSAPKIDGMNFEDVLLANGRFHKLEEGDMLYERLKPYIKHFEEYGRKWSSMLEEVAYWRKANQIHNWFVENLNNGTDEPVFTVEVTKDQLRELYKLCIEALTKQTHPHEQLPTRPGCFFGSIAYDDYYYKEIDRTKSIVENLLKNFNFETHYLLYQCSW